MKSECLATQKNATTTVWSLELRTGEQFDIIHNLVTGEWIIDEVFYNEDREDWDSRQIHRGSNKPVFDLMKRCGVKFLAS